MSSATDTRNGHLPAGLGRPALAPQEPAVLSQLAGHLELLRAFAGTVLRYLLLVLPTARSELAHWEKLAAEIPSPGLRSAALDSLEKRGNIEGAALFATLAPAAHRPATIRALVAFQSAYNYLDTLSEQPCENPRANADQLHHALLGAIDKSAGHRDYYAHSPETDDGGYLHALLDACREATTALPSFQPIATVARAATARIVDFQTLNVGGGRGRERAMGCWAADVTPPGSGLEWWETAASCGSSLSVHALIALAATPGMNAGEARLLDRAYFPWAGSLHSLLDSLVDREEDRDHGAPCLLDLYGSRGYAAVRLSILAARSLRAAKALEKGPRHRVILTAMCSYYLSAPECDTAESRAIDRALTRVLGLPLSVAVLMFRARRAANQFFGHAYT